MAAADGAADVFLDRSFAKQSGFEVPRIFEQDLFRPAFARRSVTQIATSGRKGLRAGGKTGATIRDLI
jgi:hypothetical protein